MSLLPAGSFSAASAGLAHPSGCKSPGVSLTWSGRECGRSSQCRGLCTDNSRFSGRGTGELVLKEGGFLDNAGIKLRWRGRARAVGGEEGVGSAEQAFFPHVGTQQEQEQEQEPEPEPEPDSAAPLARYQNGTVEQLGLVQGKHVVANGALQAAPTQPRKWRFGAGIWRDIMRRLPSYASDFIDGFHPKAAASVFFLYFACLAPCIAFGGLISHVTGGSIGVVETLVGTAGSGILYALTAGQPLTLLGPTGLMVVFSGLLYKASLQMGLPFLPIYGWVGIWSCLYLLLLAAIEASDLIRHFTRFTDETFSALISLGYISEAWKSICNMFGPASPFPTESAFLSLVLAAGTWRMATFLTQLRTSRLLTRPLRYMLADFGPPLSILTMAAAAHILFPAIRLPELAIPAQFSTTSGRPWLVPLFSIPPWAIVGAAVPAALLTLLVFLDQNITTRLINSPENHLTKGEGYHLDLAVLGLLMGAGSVFGLPWMFASTVPSLSHVRSLATTSNSIHLSGDNAESPEEGTVCVQENRLTGILIHVCVGASLLLLSLLRLVPTPVTDGIFLYMGITSLAGNQFVERLKLWFFDPELYPRHDFIESVPRRTLHCFTALQLACVAALWILKHSPWGITFPLLILALLPIRNYVAGSFVAPQHLAVVDAH